jgi:ankyrin repeat protein
MLEAVSEKNEAVISAVKARGLDGMTPIHLAVKGKHVKCVETLLKHHKPAEYDIWGRAPIHLAAVAPSLEIARKLLKEDSRPDQADIFGRTPLTYLKFMENEDNSPITATLQKNMAKEFMRVWKNLDAKDENGMTVLHYAVEFLNHEDIELYLKRGAKPSTKDSSGMTPLMIACQAGQSAVAKVLIDHTKSETEQDNGGRTALHYAIESDKFSTEDLGNMVEALAETRDNVLVQTQDGRTALHAAIIAGKIQIALKLLVHGAKPGTKDSEGKVALHHVAQARKIDSTQAEKLIAELIAAWENEETMENARVHSDARASSPQGSQDETTHLSYMKIIDLRDGSLRTPLHEAILADNPIVARALLRLKADVKVKDSIGRSPLHHVAESNQIYTPSVEEPLIATILNAMKAEIDMEAGVNDLDENRQTPLHVGIEANNDLTALFLLNHGADPGIVDGAGMTSLISAARKGFCFNAIEHMVLNSGEVANQGDEDYDESPIAWACENGRKEIVKLLLDADNVDPNRLATKWNNRTPLHIALRSGHEDVVKILLDSHRTKPSWETSKENGLESLRYAIYESQKNCIKDMLLHPRTSIATRIVGLKFVAGMGDQDHNDMKDIIESLEEPDLPSSELDDIVCLFPSLDSQNPVLERWMRRVKDPKRCNELRYPLHTLARVGDGNEIIRLLNMGPTVLDPDADNWTCMDIAEKYDHLKLKSILMERIPKGPTKRPPYATPSTFSNPFAVTNINLEGCSTCTPDSPPCTVARGNNSPLSMPSYGSES